MNKNKKSNLAEWIITTAKKYGSDEVSVVIAKNKQSSIEIRNGKIDLLEGSEQSSLALSLYIDNRYSVNQTSILDKSSLKDFIKNSIDLTNQINKDEFRALPDPDYYWNGIGKDLMINDTKYSKLNPEIKKNLALELEEKTRNKSRKIVSVTSSFSDSYSEVFKLNSNGFSGDRFSTTFSLGSEVVVKDGNGSLPSDWYYSYTRYFDDIPELNTIAKNSVRLAERKIGQKKTNSGIYNMIVSNRSSSKLIGMILSSLSGSKLWNKNSFLEGRINTKIFSDNITLIDDPYLKKGLGSKNFDTDGFKTFKSTIIEKGVLKRYFINEYFSKKLKIPFNSGSTSNILFENGNKKCSDLIKTLNNGIFVTGFLGGNFNSTTGDFSFGINGVLIKNGILTSPVNEMNITGNAIDLFNKLNEIGNDPYPYSSYRTPSLLFEGISFSGL